MNTFIKCTRLLSIYITFATIALYANWNKKNTPSNLEVFTFEKMSESLNSIAEEDQDQFTALLQRIISVTSDSERYQFFVRLSDTKHNTPLFRTIAAAVGLAI